MTLPLMNAERDRRTPKDRDRTRGVACGASKRAPLKSHEHQFKYCITMICIKGARIPHNKHTMYFVHPLLSREITDKTKGEPIKPI